MKKLTIREIIVVASMLFGMFFGAGNLIFPVSMGQLSGSNMWQAAAGFLIPGVGLPLLGGMFHRQWFPIWSGYRLMRNGYQKRNSLN